MHLRLVLGTIFLAGPLLNAQVAQVREYNLHTPRDRNSVFAMAITPAQDVLSFVAKPDGKWLLTRVRNWLDKTPTEQTIDVPGWTRADLAAAFGPVHLDLFVTSDGRFVICVASGHWNRNQKMASDDLISVVDLRRFEMVTSTHAPADPGEIRSFYLDGAQHLALIALTSQNTGGARPMVKPAHAGSIASAPHQAIENDERLILLDLPSLAIADQCQLSDSKCDRYLNRLVDSRGFSRIRPSDGSGQVTQDGRFKLEYAQNFHHNLLDRKRRAKAVLTD